MLVASAPLLIPGILGDQSTEWEQDAHLFKLPCLFKYTTIEANGTTLKRGLESGCKLNKGIRELRHLLSHWGMSPEKRMLLSEHSLVLGLPN